MNGNANYTRLPGRGFPILSVFGASYRLFKSDDHLLYIFHNMAVEEYRRFFYSDIQSIQFTPSRRFLINNIIIAMILLISGTLFILLDDLWPVFMKPYVAMVMIGLPLGLLLGNIFMGRTCRTFLTTQVQTIELPSLNRIKNTRKVIQTLEPLIRSAQPAWSNIRPAISATPSHSPVSEQPSQSPAAAPVRISTRWYVYLAILTGCVAVSSVYDIFLFNDIKNIFDTILLLLIISVDIIAILRQRSAQIPTILRISTWSVMIVIFGMMYLTAFSMGFTRLYEPRSSWLSVEPSNPVMAVIATVIAFVYALQALLFCIGLIQYKRQSRG